LVSSQPTQLQATPAATPLDEWLSATHLILDAFLAAYDEVHDQQQAILLATLIAQVATGSPVVLPQRTD
jgi:hypothetical protein